MSIIVKVKRVGFAKSEKYTPAQFRRMAYEEGAVTTEERDFEHLTTIAEEYVNFNKNDTTVKIVIKKDV